MAKRTIDQLTATLDKIEKQRIEADAALSHIQHREHKIRAELTNRLLEEPERAIPSGVDSITARIYRGYVYQYGAGSLGFTRWNLLSMGRGDELDDEVTA